MEKASTDRLLFYQKIGELFYAIAAADKVVRTAEYEKLTELVEERWKNIDDYHDEFGADAAYQISIVFEWFDYEQMDADDCFNNFSEYYREHKRRFGQNREALIVQTAHEIADAFSGTNKSELVMLAKLQLLFNKK